MTQSISLLAERLGLLRRRRAALHSLLMSSADVTLRCSAEQAAPSSDELTSARDELISIESEMVAIEQEYRRLQENK